MDKTIAGLTARHLKVQGITRVFMYPGGTIAPLVNACLALGIDVERFASEQGAGYAALAVARLTREPQVFMVTSGPGLTNAISPLADAYYDSLPLVLIAGQVGTKDLGSRKAVRQRGFQEVPAVDITAPISKHAVCLDTIDKAVNAIPMAFNIAKSGRMGPVVLDFPMDIQRTEIDLTSPQSMAASPCEFFSSSADEADLADMASALRKARRPMIMLGQGAQFAAKFHAYRELTIRADALVVTSFLGLGSYDTEDARFVGYVGHTGHLAANRAVHQADFLLVLGSRLDVRQTGTMTADFVPNGRVAWVDVDINELENPRVSVDWKFNTHVESFCEKLLAVFKERECATDAEWRKSILELKALSLEDSEAATPGTIQPKDVLTALAPRLSGENVAIVTGVGCHQHWAARHLPFAPHGPRLLTSGGHGTMGFDLPTAIGAAMDDSARKVLCVVGDGSLLMNIQELMSLAERRLSVKVLVLNNNRLGIVSQFQLITWGADPASGQFHAPDFAKIAEGFGIPSFTLARNDELEPILTEFWQLEGPALMNVQIDADADIVPMLLAGQKMDEMWSGRKS